MKAVTLFSTIIIISSVFLPILAGAEPTYFIVGELPGHEWHHDSYILPLQNPNDIAYARHLIQYGPLIGPSIVVAEVMAGSDGINRNWIAPGQPLWSWHVSKFIGFADMTAEVLDGWPSGIEDYPEFWIGSSGKGNIGFWNYTVTREVTIVPVVPEPISSILFITGGTLLAGRRYLRRMHNKSLE